ncbi:MAG: hypothetical protein MHM6MM_004912 [Cercozoa sp. M6MM]
MYGGKPSSTKAPAKGGADYAPTKSLEDIASQVASLSKKVKALEGVSAAPSAGEGCASQCLSAMNAKAPHLCPKWCTGLSSKPSLALSVLEDGAVDPNNVLSSDDTICLFAEVFQALGDATVLDGDHEHAGLLGFRVPIVKKASKVRASLRIGVEGVVEDDDVAKFWMASVDDTSLPKLLSDTAIDYVVDATAFPNKCGEDGKAVGALLKKGLTGKDDSLVKSQVEGALLDIDMSKEMQHLVNGKNWQFNNIVLILLRFDNAAGDPQNTAATPLPDGPYPVLPVSELILKFARPHLGKPKPQKHYGYGSSYGGSYGSNYGSSYGYEQPGYGYDSYGAPSYGGYDNSYGGYGNSYGGYDNSYGGYDNSYGGYDNSYGGYDNSYGAPSYGGHDNSYGYAGYDNSYASYDQYDNGYGNIGAYGSSGSYGSGGYSQGYDNSYASYNQYDNGYGHIQY